MTHWSGPDLEFEALLAGQRELAELDADAAVRHMPPPPGLRDNDPELREVTRAEAAAAERDVARSTMPSLPTIRRPSVEPVPAANASPAAHLPLARRGRGWIRGSVAVLAAAAAIVLAIGLTESTSAQRDESGAPLESASQLAQRNPETRPIQRTPLQTRKKVRRPARRPAPAVAMPQLPEVAAPLESSAPARRAEPAAEPLDVLETRARQQLAAGDLDGARRSFRKLTRRGGRSSRAELAYGELFALARRSGTRKDQAALWEAYLRRFPRGRFADDARAGLCGRAQMDDRAACWSDYLRDFPQGSHRGRALREQGGSQP